MSRIYRYFNQILFYLFLCIYILLLAKILLFKQVSPFELFNSDRMISRTVSLTPFKTIFEYFSDANINIWIALMNVVGNIVIFIPMGLYLQIFKKNKNILNSVVLVFAVSLCVEVIQYILGIGSADTDDIILNTFGGFLGVLIYRIIYLLLKDEDKTKTAVTFLFCIICVCFGAWYIVCVNVLGLRIRIF